MRGFYQMDAVQLCKQLEDNSVHLLWTDPPYGLNNKQRLHSTGEEYHDITPEEVVRLCSEIATEALRFLQDDGLMAICLDYRSVHQVAAALSQILVPHGEIIWQFETGGLAKKFWANKHATVLMFGKSKTKPKFDFAQVPTVPRKAPKPGYTDDKKLNSVWSINVSTTDPQRSGYPNQKPEALVENFVKVHTVPGDLVVDPFCGSGTVAVVAERLNRWWVCGDTNPAAITIAEQRLSALPRGNA